MPHSYESQTWQAPRWTQGMTSAHPLTPRGMSLNHWQSPLRPPPTGDATSAGFVGVDVGRQDNSGTGWNSSGKGSQQGGSTTTEITDRDPVQKRDFQEPGARLKPLLRSLVLETRHKHTSAQAWCQIVQGDSSRNGRSKPGRSIQ